VHEKPCRQCLTRPSGKDRLSRARIWTIFADNRTNTGYRLMTKAAEQLMAAADQYAQYAVDHLSVTVASNRDSEAFLNMARAGFRINYLFPTASQEDRVGLLGLEVLRSGMDRTSGDRREAPVRDGSACGAGYAESGLRFAVAREKLRQSAFFSQLTPLQKEILERILFALPAQEMAQLR
jgi:hypothetical protein